MTDDNYAIVEELKKITKLLILMVTKDQTQRANIEMLSKVGLPPKDIAELLATTPNTVSVTLSGLRKRPQSRKDPKASDVL